MHCYVCCCLFLGQEWSKVNSVKLNISQTCMLLLCYDCKRQTKQKSEDGNKTNPFFCVCLAGLSDEK